MPLPPRFAAYEAARAAPRDYLLLGLGRRRKLIWRGDALYDAFTSERLKHWPGAGDVWVQPAHPRVWFSIPHHQTIAMDPDDPNDVDVWDYWPMEVVDNEHGTWVGNRGSIYSRRSHSTIMRKGEYLSESPVTLPRFAAPAPRPGAVDQPHPYDVLLQVLLGEILFNVRASDGAPLPNLFVYDKPWYRDAAMVAMVLAKTNNLHLIHDWVMSLRDPFDRNNAGHEEPDNLGQVLYLVSLVSDRTHPVVAKVLEQIPRFRRGDHIAGLSDFAEHPVYQTKWLKVGLRALGLDDPFVIPQQYDSYSSLFWWDYKHQHVPGPRFDVTSRERYPYLAWAEAHFYGDPPPLAPGVITSDGDWKSPRNHFTGPYPLTWESHASQADYAGMARLSEADARDRTCRPHTWHAAEMFLYLLERGGAITASDPILDRVMDRGRSPPSTSGPT